MFLFLFPVGYVHAGLIFTDFSGHNEGESVSTFEDSGITLSNLELRDDERSNIFVVDTLATGSIVSGNALLNFGTYGSGDGYGLAPFGNADIAFGEEVANSAVVKIFDAFAYDSGYEANSLSLEAMLDGVVVAEDSIKFFTNGAAERIQFLTIEGRSFDSLRLVATGSYDGGRVVMAIDSVAINIDTASVPEPNTLILFSMLALVLFRKKIKT